MAYPKTILSSQQKSLEFDHFVDVTEMVAFGIS